MFLLSCKTISFVHMRAIYSKLGNIISIFPAIRINSIRQDSTFYFITSRVVNETRFLLHLHAYGSPQLDCIYDLIISLNPASETELLLNA
jgi:hypothetical protein